MGLLSVNKLLVLLFSSLGFFAWAQPQAILSHPAPGFSNAGPSVFIVEWNSVVTGFDDPVTDLMIHETGTISYNVEISAPIGNQYSVTFSALTGDGTLYIDILAGAVEDSLAQPNLLITGNPNLQLTIDNTVPVVTVGAPSKYLADLTDNSPIITPFNLTGADFSSLDANTLVLVKTGDADALVATQMTSGKALRPQLKTQYGRVAYDLGFSIDPTVNGLTLEAWILLESGSLGLPVISFDSYSHGFSLDVVSEGPDYRIRVQIGDGFGLTTMFRTGLNPLITETWNHIALTCDGIEFQLFINGSFIQPDLNFYSPIVYGTDDFLLMYTDQYDPRGKLDDVRVWNTVRTASEIRDHMNGDLTGSELGLVAWWGFDQYEDLASGAAGTNDIQDLSGNGYHLDVSGNPDLVSGNSLFGGNVILDSFSGFGTLDLMFPSGIATDQAANPSVEVLASGEPSWTSVISVNMSGIVPPVVNSITPAQSSPTNAQTLAFQVVFSEDVTGFAPNDIDTIGVGLLSSGSVSIIALNPSTYDVSVGPVQADGGLFSSLAIKVKIGAVQDVDLAFNTTPFQSAAVQIDQNPPEPNLSSSVTSPTSQSPIGVDLTFTEDIIGLELTDVGVTNAALQNLTGSGSAYHFEAVPIVDGLVSLSFNYGGVTDLAGNPNIAGSHWYIEWTYDSTRPSVTSITATSWGPLQTDHMLFHVLFMEPVTGFEDAGDITVLLSGSLLPTSTPLVLITSLSSTEYDVAVSGLSGDGLLQLQVNEDTALDHVGLGNVLALSNAVKINNSLPVITQFTPSKNQLGPLDSSVSVTIDWDQGVSGFERWDIQINHSGTYNACCTSLVQITDTQYRLDIPFISGEGQFSVSVLAGQVQDLEFPLDSNQTTQTSGFMTRTETPFQIGRFSIAYPGETLSDLGGGDYDFIGQVGDVFLINQWYQLEGPSVGIAPTIEVRGNLLTANGVLRLTGMADWAGDQVIATSPIQLDSNNGMMTAAFAPIAFGNFSVDTCALALIPGNRLAVDGQFIGTADHTAFKNLTFSPGSSGGEIFFQFGRFFPSTGCDVDIFEFQVLYNLVETDLITLKLYFWDSGSYQAETVDINLTIHASGAPGYIGSTVGIHGHDWEGDNIEFYEGIVGEPAGVRFTDLQYADFTDPTFDKKFVMAECKLDGTANPMYGDIRALDALITGIERELASFGNPDLRGDTFTSYQTNLHFQNGTPEYVFDAGYEVEVNLINSQILFKDDHPLRLGGNNVLTVRVSDGGASITRDGYMAPKAVFATNVVEIELTELSLRQYDGLLSYQTQEGILGSFLSEGLTVEVTGMSMMTSLSDQPVLPLALTFPPQLFLGIPVKGQVTGPISNNTINLADYGGDFCIGGIPRKLLDTSFSIPHMCAGLHQGPPAYWDGDLNVWIPVAPAVPVEITGNLKVIGGALDSLTLGGHNLAIPLGYSGATLEQVDASIQNLTGAEGSYYEILSLDGHPPITLVHGSLPVTFVGSMLFTGGPKIAGLVPLFSATVAANITDARISAHGEVWLISTALGIQLAGANALIRYSGPLLQVRCTAMGFLGLLKGSAFVSASPTSASGMLKTGIKIPPEIPLVGGLSVADASLGIYFGPLVISGAFHIIGIGLNFSIDSNAGFSFSKNRDMQIESWETPFMMTITPKAEEPGSMESLTSISFNTNLNKVDKVYSSDLRMDKAGSSQVLTTEIVSEQPTIIRLFYEQTGGDPRFNVTTPDGQILTPETTNLDPNSDGTLLYMANSTAKDAAFWLRAPVTGTYSIEILYPETLGSFGIETLDQNRPPEFSFVNISTNSSEIFAEWTVQDVDDDAQIQIFLDTNREIPDGQRIAGPFSEDSGPTNMVYDFMANALSPGVYWPYAEVYDGRNAPVYVYSDVPILIFDPNAPPPVRNIQVQGAGTTAVVSWDLVDDPDVYTYEVQWTEHLDESIYESGQSIPPDMNSAVILGLEQNKTYRFTVKAIKSLTTNKSKWADDLLEIYNQARQKIPHPPQFTHEGDILEVQAERLAHYLRLQSLQRKATPDLIAFENETHQHVTVSKTNPPVNAESLELESDVIELLAAIGDNNKPVFESNPLTSILASELFFYQLSARDEDGDPINYQLIQGPAGMVLANGDELRWDPLGITGDFDIIARASDGTDFTDQSWQLTSGNLYPIPALEIVSDPDPQVNPGDLFSYLPMTRGGVDSLPLMFSLLDAPEGLTMDPATGFMEWQTQLENSGEFLVVFKVWQSSQGQTLVEQVGQFTLELDADSDQMISQVKLSLPAPCDGGPTAVLTGSATLCAGYSKDLQVELTGTPPWTIIWSDGQMDTGIFSNPFIRTVSPSTNKIYRILSVSDSLCSGTSSGQASLVFDILGATASIISDGSICVGESFDIEVQLTGTGPWDITWSDGTVYNNIVNPTHIHSVSPTIPSTYWIEAFHDTICPSGTISGSAFVDIKENVSIVNQPATQTICPGGSLALVVSTLGTAPITYQWFKNSASLTGQTEAILQIENVSLNDEGIYTCQVGNDCSTVLSDDAQLTVDGPLTARISPTVQPQGLSLVSLWPIVSCNLPTTVWTWANDDTNEFLGLNYNPLVLNRVLTQTTVIRLEVTDELSRSTTVAYGTILVSTNPIVIDLNGDLCNNLTDFWLMSENWLRTDTGFDANDDGILNILDFMYLSNTDSINCPD